MTKARFFPLLALTLAFGLTACFGDKDDTDNKDDSGETEGDADTDADTDGDADPDAPTIEEADGYCYQHKTGDKFYQWEVNCIADDPQGADTLVSFDAENSIVMVLNDSGGEIADYALVCNDSGECFGSFRESDHGVACSNASAYTLRFQVVDEDGNISAPYSIQGRQQ
jgi:hypothetical protein